MNERYVKGIANLQEIDGSAGKDVIESLSGITADIGKYIIEFAFGDVYDRGTLDLKQREMITITSLLTQGDTEPQLVVHINGALNVGLTEEEIIETFIQCIPYVGFPRVLNAVSVAKKVFEKRNAELY
ncbi:carboxymuconolactone decarboxylase family protein [Lactobacillus sp. YT155]|uniref:carboxymuconolactone decarboxylase family protein n=1 Tax=Lactobacillus sp. YT155 TaxID=3060955 RepID=UPI00265F4DEB|nr:carboxymuconolactone decarboxylase family protein [Lactobacillus sp. YT155]MDO1605026.1 carboxymuconolactone decarboxylase family protein [Lactobacillus sp. YT155]